VRAALAFALVMLASAPALAQEEQRAETVTVRAPREIPAYGRAPEQGDDAEDLLWIPRILFFPVHLFFEYVLRVPLHELFRMVELEHVDSMFARGAPTGEEPDPSWWFVPIFRYDHGFEPTAGISFHLRDEERLALRTGVDFWGLDQIRGRLRAALRSGQTQFVFAGMGAYRDDRVFHGIGWNSSDQRARYWRARGEWSVSIASQIWQRSGLAAGMRVSLERFGQSEFRQGRDRALDPLVAPPGYADGYTALVPYVRATIDTRPEGRWPHASGVRFEVFGEWGANAERGAGASFGRAGAQGEIALELMSQRTLRVRGLAEIAEPFGSEPVPFTELVWLGGRLDRMPGFLDGRLIGQSAVSFGLSWRYAIWSWMDAELFVDAGNVFGSLFEDFAVERARLSFGTAIGSRDPQDFTLLVAFGTEPFALGTHLSSVRVAVSIGSLP
jgi:hypothetical protein